MYSISTERYTGTTIEQDTQQAMPCDILRFEPESIDKCIMSASLTDDIFTHTVRMLYTSTMEIKRFLVPLFYCPWLYAILMLIQKRWSIFVCMLTKTP